MTIPLDGELVSSRLRKGVRNQSPNGPEGPAHYWFLTPFLSRFTGNGVRR